MESILRLLSRTASAPMVTPPIARIMMAISTTQSSNPIEAATKRHERMFLLYIAALVVTALLIAALTWIVEKSSNALQDAIQAEANARIAEARQRSDEANALAQAARADAEAARVEQERLKKDSLQLAIQLQEVKSTSTAAQEKIQELEEANKPRVISEEQQRKIAGLLKVFAGQEVQLKIFSQNIETNEFAAAVMKTLSMAGIKVSPLTVISAGREPAGFGVVVHDPQSVPILAEAIVLAFRSTGIGIGGDSDPQVPTGQFFLIIGEKMAPKSN